MADLGAAAGLQAFVNQIQPQQEPDYTGFFQNVMENKQREATADKDRQMRAALAQEKALLTENTEFGNWAKDNGFYLNKKTTNEEKATIRRLWGQRWRNEPYKIPEGMSIEPEKEEKKKGMSMESIYTALFGKKGAGTAQKIGGAIGADIKKAGAAGVKAVSEDMSDYGVIAGLPVSLAKAMGSVAYNPGVATGDMLQDKFGGPNPEEMARAQSMYPELETSYEDYLNNSMSERAFKK